MWPARLEEGFKFYRNLDPDFVREQKADASLTTVVVEIGPADGKIEILNKIGRALQFPEGYFQYMNWDSFHEAVRDLDWLKWQGLVIVLTGCNAAWRRDYATMGTLLEILNDAHRKWAAKIRHSFSP